MPIKRWYSILDVFVMTFVYKSIHDFLAPSDGSAAAMVNFPWGTLHLVPVTPSSSKSLTTEISECARNNCIQLVAEYNVGVTLYFPRFLASLVRDQVRYVAELSNG
jgi:hypothetical protein